MVEMVVFDTPWQLHQGVWVKREDLCCPTGPHFSKSRGVFAHVARRREQTIGVLDTSHSQGGWAVAQACSLLDKHCVLFYPVRKGHEFDPLPPQQQAAQKLGAELVALPAGRSAILYHRARKLLTMRGGYMMPNALKLTESVTETAAEFERGPIPDGRTIVVSASSGTIAAGVIRGALMRRWRGRVIIHMGYSRSHAALVAYVRMMVGVPILDAVDIEVVDEGYGYADAARPGSNPDFPCNAFYDLKAWRWLQRERASGGSTAVEGGGLFWNIG